MKRAVFLDRDGVINEVLSDRVKFVNSPQDFYLLDGVGEAIHKLNEANYEVFVVTNQGGIGLGYMSVQDLQKIHDHMREEIARFGGEVTDIQYCPHKPHARCSCRKPHPKMIIDLAHKYDIDLSDSYMVGDRKPDIQAGEYAGVKTVLVGNREENIEADQRFNDLLSFANFLIDDK